MRVLVKKGIIIVQRRALDISILGWACFGYRIQKTQVRGNGTCILVLIIVGIKRLELKSLQLGWREVDGF